MKTPFKADLKHEGMFYFENQNPIQPNMNLTLIDEDATLKMPLTFGIGIAYKPSDVLTVSLTYQRTQWNDFMLSDKNGETSPITGEKS